MSEQARVTNVTIGRLYNLGNYEHVRYEISVEIPEGSDAGEATTRLKTLLWAMRPAMNEYGYKHAAAILADPETMLRNYDEEERAKTLAQSQELVTRVQAARKRVKDAVAALGNLQLATQFKDAKEEWDEDR